MAIFGDVYFPSTTIFCQRGHCIIVACIAMVTGAVTGAGIAGVMGAAIPANISGVTGITATAWSTRVAGTATTDGSRVTGATTDAPQVSQPPRGPMHLPSNVPMYGSLQGPGVLCRGNFVGL